MRHAVGVVPDPWAFLHERLPDVVLVRAPTPEPGRYYHRERVIMMRSGMRLDEERRYLWHEIVHALRGDETCAQDWLVRRMEDSVEREAARRAMPLSVMEEALQAAVDFHDFADRMKVPEEWVRFRVAIAHPAEKALLDRAAARWEESA